MPFYNVEQYIDQAIKSVLNQTYEDFELIMINDGSTDHSQSIIHSYLSDSRLKLIDTENAGVSAARNDGIKEAKGTYISFIDSDDEIDINFLMRMMEKVKSNPADIVMCGYFKEQLNEDESLKSQVPVQMKAGNYTRENPPDWKVDADQLAMMGYIWNKLYKREILTKHLIQFNEEMNFLEDIDFNTLVFKASQTFIVIEECLYHYKRRSRTSLVSTFRSNDFDMQLQSILNRQEIMQEWGSSASKAEQAVAYLHVHTVKGYCVNLFLNKNQLTFAEKCDYLNEVIERPLTQERVLLFEPQNMIDRILEFTIGKRMGYALALISTLYSAQKRVLKLKIQ